MMVTMMVVMMVLVILKIVVVNDNLTTWKLVIEASWLHEHWDPHEGYMIIWLYAYKLIYIEDCGCHWGKLPAWALRSAWRKAQLLIWIVLPRAANSTFDNHHDCHQHHHCRHHHYMIEYQWLCLPGCDLPILRGVVNPSPKMETSGRLQLIHEEALHKCTGCNFSRSDPQLCAHISICVMCYMRTCNKCNRMQYKSMHTGSHIWRISIVDQRLSMAALGPIIILTKVGDGVCDCKLLNGAYKCLCIQIFIKCISYRFPSSITI